MMGLCIKKTRGVNNLYEKFLELSIKKPKKKKAEREREILSGDITIVLRENMQLYIKDIEDCTGRKMTQNQRNLITCYVNNNRILRNDPSEHGRRRKDFAKKRASLREEWERKTGQTWPKYKENIYDSKGRVIRQEGQPYDAHHIVELSYRGPNVWYNLFPAKHPDEHQQGIHREKSIASQIFIDENNRPKMAKDDEHSLNEKKGKHKRKLRLKKYIG